VEQFLEPAGNGFIFLGEKITGTAFGTAETAGDFSSFELLAVITFLLLKVFMTMVAFKDEEFYFIVVFDRKIDTVNKDLF